MPQPLTVIPVSAPVQDQPFDLIATLNSRLDASAIKLGDGDVVAVSSKYASIAGNRIIDLANVQPTKEAQELAERYKMDAATAQLVLEEADHIFGGIELGFLLTTKGGVLSPNAGLDRSNIPSGKAVLLPEAPFALAETIRQALQKRYGCRIGVILTDSWLMPGRYGTTGVAIAMAGFQPIKDERGKQDLFGNPMAVTQVGVADSLAVCAQVVMGERNEATPFALVRGAEIELTDSPLSAEVVSIPWRHCIYIESLTLGMIHADAGASAVS
ncbi:MAG: coenzyme F420-0:L-glutamate ligase [Chloroflexi bacterium]|nr:coenzyme F420-0:L-glutamate ligase [Chloroflexota bacterium]